MKKYAFYLFALSAMFLISCDKEDDDDETPIIEAPANLCETDVNYLPLIEPANFVTSISEPNQYFPLITGRTLVLEGMDDEGVTEREEWTTTGEIITIMGVTCFVVNDKAFLDDELIEDTDDWYAQDIYGNVWYFGESVEDYENGVLISTAGSWKAGEDVALPGVRMPANPFTGNIYRQEYYVCQAEDMAQDISLSKQITTPLNSYSGCLQVEEWTPLEPDALHENKYYAPGVGYVRIEKIGSTAFLELIEIID